VALRRIARLGDTRYAPYLPRLVDTARFDTAPGGGPRRRANVLGRLDGFVSLGQVRAAYPGGVDVRDAAWMWRRLLVVLGHAHRAGAAHGAVLPEHVLIHPGDHGLVLADWCGSTRARSGRSSVTTCRRRCAAPAVFPGDPGDGRGAEA
jgi:hypothetical protein